jgi:hypothetical protein
MPTVLLNNLTIVQGAVEIVNSFLSVQELPSGSITNVISRLFVVDGVKVRVRYYHVFFF